ncbi:uncharacterized protein LOC117653572 isoform X2 [Thrips palmi]|uniref:Uncharacterized protein LOC117653572 isoform X2 n=1 Tax=Thrips palmi TaxID=161013 RepID=A0A6P9AAW7_THRPL|nr:uncharacterized protein LOC117653572 isoform X2 [Thrips palmi]
MSCFLPCTPLQFKSLHFHGATERKVSERCTQSVEDLRMRLERNPWYRRKEMERDTLHGHQAAALSNVKTVECVAQTQTTKPASNDSLTRMKTARIALIVQA